jgi:hypothetical protein
MDGKVRPVVQQGVDLLWVQVTTSAECKKVSRYSLFREGATNTAEKEPIKALINLSRLTNIVFSVKSVFEEMLMKTAFDLGLSSPQS